MAKEKLKEYGFNLELQEKAKQYQNDQLKVRAVRYSLLLALAILIMWLGVSSGFQHWISSFISAKWGAAAIYVLIFSIAFWLLDLPFDHIFYLIEHRYGLSRQSLRSWFRDELKGGAISLLLLLMLALGIYYLMAAFPNAWWLLGWAFATIFFILMTFVGPVILMPLFFKFEPLEDQTLVERLKRLAAKAGIKILGVHKMKAGEKTKKVVGALTGIGATRRIILSDTLLENYSPDEIETVIAHELGHHVHRDIPKAIAFFSLIILIGFVIVHYALSGLSGLFGIADPADIATLPLFALILSLLIAVISPLFKAFSRRFEGEADQYALELAEKPEAQAKVDVKICDQNLRYADPHPVIEFLFYDHPAGVKRVERALRFRKEQ